MINFKTNLYKKLTGFLTKKGNKIRAKNIVDSSFLLLSKKLRCPLPSLVFLVFKILNTFVEAKKVRVKRRMHIVPFSITLRRRSYLIIKWLIQAVSENNEKISMIKKIYKEVLLLLVKKKRGESKAFKLKQLNNKLAISNRSKMHYRW